MSPALPDLGGQDRPPAQAHPAAGQGTSRPHAHHPAAPPPPAAPGTHPQPGPGPHPGRRLPDPAVRPAPRPHRPAHHRRHHPRRRRPDPAAAPPPPPPGPPPLPQPPPPPLLRRAPPHTQAPVRPRAAACLTLLFPQPPARIVRLTIDDIIHGDDGQILLRLGDPPAPVPEPFAALLLQLPASPQNMNTATNPATPWLFPGRRAGHPLHPAPIAALLCELGITT